MLEYENEKHLQDDFPGVGSATPTPLASLWDSGSPLRVESGKRARDTIVEILEFDVGQFAIEPSSSPR